MSEEFVKIEVNSTMVEARKGAMLIEVTDAMGITVPRFCYHKKLSVAANCRMCLVEVERSPKPVPACATPVMDGMKVYTRSPKAIAAQKGTMEFLLINHPLDCPICDQGGECELQDLAMGYGRDVSRFTERKRVVQDKDIGPLIATEMTRCIHCTRCVRFGDEIAGLPELGATGRGENMEIGTYISKSIVSELSGNVIDLCPVGALTAKPSRYSGRSWEYVQHAAIAPHDSVGSNIYIHTVRNKVMRVVPRENEAVNETWISDRDRFSYEGIYSADRITQPLVREGTGLVSAEWDSALEAASNALQAIIAEHGPESVGFLVAPTATLEEMYLAQKLARDLGVANIDHRLRQGDFSNQEEDPIYPWLGQPLAELEQLGAALLVGSNPRIEQPLAGHRFRKAALAGGKILFINPRRFDFRFPVMAEMITDPVGMISALAGVAKAVAAIQGKSLPDNLERIVEAAPVGEIEQTMAEQLVGNDLAAVFLGNLAVAHPAYAQLQALAGFVARASGSSLGYLPEAANSVGGCLAGVLPHRLPGGKSAPTVGLNARAMLDSPRKAYVLFGIEPEFDCWNPAGALGAVHAAELVISLSPYASETAKQYANFILPTATFAETSGTYTNAEGRWQSFQGAVSPLGESRPGWKILRVLGNRLNLPGFDYMDSKEVLAEVQSQCQGAEPLNLVDITQPFEPFEISGPIRVADVPIYAVDAIVRRAKALQATPLTRPACIYLNPEFARELGLGEVNEAQVRQQEKELVLPIVLDESVPKSCICLSAGLTDTALLGPMIGAIEISAVDGRLDLRTAVQ